MIKTGDKQNANLMGNVLELHTQGDGCCSPVSVKVLEGTTDQVRLMSAMSDPTRLQIVAMLAGQSEPLCVCEVQAHFNLGQPTISHHLKVLRETGLVTWEKRGLWVYYSLDRATLEQAASYLNNLLSLPKSSIVAG